MNDAERIEEALSELTEVGRVEHRKALEVGDKDVPCPLCPKVFLAGQQFKDCGRLQCFFAMGELARSALRLQSRDPDQLGIELDTP